MRPFNNLGGNCRAASECFKINSELPRRLSLTNRLLILSLVIAGFGVLSAIALVDAGYWGIIAPHFQSWGAAQVFTDLVILAVLSCIWMLADARKRGIPAWPFIAVTLFAGSFGPLLYLVMREIRAPGDIRSSD
jgi:hypothetical protein